MAVDNTIIIHVTAFTACTQLHVSMSPYVYLGELYFSAQLQTWPFKCHVLQSSQLNFLWCKSDLKLFKVALSFNGVDSLRPKRCTLL